MSQNIVVAGNAPGLDGFLNFALIRYLSDGSRDTSFGTGGLVLTPFGVGTDCVALALTVQADGKYVAAGFAPVAAVNYFALARYNADGTLDTGFGTAGLVTTTFAGATDSRVQGVAVQGDGKIVAAGSATIGTDLLFVLARYNTDGTLDAGFGTGGKITTSFGESPATDGAFAVLIQGDGKIVAVGLSNANPLATSFGLIRYNTDGTLDTTGFGTGGKVSTDFGGNGAQGFAAVLQGDGKIVAAGMAKDGGGNVGFGLARYNTDGSLDAGFGTGGLVTTFISGTDVAHAQGTVVQPDDKVVAVGTTQDATNGLYALARYTTAGVLDPAFGTGGKVTTDVSAGVDSFLLGTAVQADGLIVAVGQGTTGGLSPVFGLARYTTAGVLDPSFGTSGLVNDPANGGGYASAVVLVAGAAPASSAEGPILLTLV